VKLVELSCQFRIATRLDFNCVLLRKVFADSGQALVCSSGNNMEPTRSFDRGRPSPRISRRAESLPSALDHMDSLLKRADTFAFLLDYDGTLTAIVEDPNGAVLGERVRGILQELARLYPVAIVTGRSREKIIQLVGIKGVYYAGSHGFDIEVPLRKSRPSNGSSLENGEISALADAMQTKDPEDAYFRYHIAEEVIPVLREAARHLRSIFGLEEPASDLPEPERRVEGQETVTANVQAPKQMACSNIDDCGAPGSMLLPPLPIQPEPSSPPVFDPSFLSQVDRLLTERYAVRGIGIEDNLLSISIHYRRCDPAHVPTIEKIVDSIAYKYGLRKTRGKCVFELRPAVKWDKGRAAKWLLEMIQCREKREYVPVYVGDDVTDEDALRFVTNFGGVGIIVTEDDSRETAATWRLRDPDEVAEFLEHFVRARPGGVSPSSS